MNAFDRYIGIDYSGAKTPTSSLPGLRIYMANRISPPVEVQPPRSPRKYWTRKEIAEWLVERLSENQPILVGIDHGFSFPEQYFQTHHLPLDWQFFLDDFQRRWPTDGNVTSVESVRSNNTRWGSPRWRRLTELRSRTAKSVFHFDVQGSVAKSTHAGLPWLRFIRQQVGNRVHFWPFDGWEIPARRSAIAEVYPALWNKSFPSDGRNPHQQDAYSVAAWVRRADQDDSLSDSLNPQLTPAERKLAQIEGWILGIK